MSTDDPRSLADTAEVLAAMGDPHTYRQYIAGALPAPPLSVYVKQAEADVEHLAQRARVPDWVRDPAKWQTLSRSERRALQRHHEKEMRRDIRRGNGGN